MGQLIWVGNLYILLVKKYKKQTIMENHFILNVFSKKTVHNVYIGSNII